MSENYIGAARSGAANHASTVLQNTRFDALCKTSWVAAYTSSRHEKAVAHGLSLRKIEHYLPLYSKVVKWKNGMTMTTELPLFPSYIFVRIRPTQRMHVLEVPGILSVIGGTGRELATFRDTEIEALQTGTQLHRAEPHPCLSVGQRVRIKTGSFCGMEGFVLRSKNGIRVVLRMDQIMKCISIEVDENTVEPCFP